MLIYPIKSLTKELYTRARNLLEVQSERNGSLRMMAEYFGVQTGTAGLQE